jgi:hypothetical protein
MFFDALLIDGTRHSDSGANGIFETLLGFWAFYHPV